MPWTNTKSNGEDARCAVCGLSGMYDARGGMPGLPKHYRIYVQADQDHCTKVDRAWLHNSCIADWHQAHPRYALQLA